MSKTKKITNCVRRVISPLLSNIMLHELDKELEKQGLKYVRYADDFSIYTKSSSSARTTGNKIFLFLKNKLKLPINREKSGIRKPVQFELLGHRFVPTYKKGTKGKYQLVVSEKSWNKLKQNIKTTTRKTTPLSIAERINKLKEVGRGWLNYFRMASITGKLKDFDSWIRNRLRYCIWHNWKKPERKRKNLLRSGVDQHHAYAWSRTRMGGWAVAQSPILVTTITLERLKKRGYEPLLDYYFKVSPQLNEPLYTRPVRTVCERRTSSLTSGEAVYLIIGSRSRLSNLSDMPYLSAEYLKKRKQSFAELFKRWAPVDPSP